MAALSVSGTFRTPTLRHEIEIFWGEPQNSEFLLVRLRRASAHRQGTKPPGRSSPTYRLDHLLPSVSNQDDVRIGVAAHQGQLFSVE